MEIDTLVVWSLDGGVRLEGETVEEIGRWADKELGFVWCVRVGVTSRDNGHGEMGGRMMVDTRRGQRQSCTVDLSSPWIGEGAGIIASL